MDSIKQELRRLLKETLTIAQTKSVAEREQFIRIRLSQIQTYCKSMNKTFITHELKVTCNEYELGGSYHQTATLFRGPSEDASVAICVTDQGSLLHRNGSLWRAYCNAGDINLTAAKATEQHRLVPA